MKPETIPDWHDGLAASERAICDRLRALIEDGLPDAGSRLWHAHPVWFLEGNPIVGYSVLKDGVRLMFWSGQSFDAPGLTAAGSFKAAERRYTDAGQIDDASVAAWLSQSREIRWDYANIVARKGRLKRLR